MQEKFDEIVAQLIDASRIYYQTGNPSFLSDEEYDSKMLYLEELVSENPQLVTPDYLALLEKVASGTEVENDKRVEYSVPMLSLQKANSDGEILKFLDDTSSFGADKNGWVVQAKLDGIAISAKYENGKLKRVSTRGDGVFGEDITENVFSVDLKFEGLPFELDGDLNNATFEVRGEALMLLDDFENENRRVDEINERIVDANELRKRSNKRLVKFKESFANPRNTTAGLLKRLPVKIDDEYVVFDLETTTREAKEQYIIEFAGVKYQNGREIDRFSTLVKPPVKINAFTESCNGINDDIVKDAPAFEEVAEKIAKFIENTQLVGHNINNFDCPILKSELKRAGYTFNNRTFDTLSFARLVEEGYLKHTLGEICKRHSIINEQAHRALADVIANHEVLLALADNAKRNPHIINFIAYNVVEADCDEKLIKNYEGFNFVEKITQDYLSSLELSVLCKDSESVMNVINAFGKLRLGPDFQLPTDGAVIKCFDDAEITAKMGQTAHHPRSAIAFKYPPEQKTTTVREIRTEVGRTGRLSFIAQFDEIHLDGSKVSKATLHNADWLSEKDVRVGSLIAVVKANDIIPYVAAVLENDSETVPFELPMKCPLCETPLEKRTLLWRCPNDFCDSRGVEAFKTAVSRRYFDIESLSTATLNSLNHAGLIHDLADIFALTLEELINLPLCEEGEDGKWLKRKNIDKEDILLGAKTAQTIYDSISKAKRTSLEKCLAALNIPGLGLQIAKNLVRKFNSIEEILNASKEDLEEVELISELKSTQIIEGLNLRRGLIKKMQNAGVEFKNQTKTIEGDLANKLEGETVVISGEIPGYNRDDAKELIESLGGKTSGTVSSKTTLIIADVNFGTSKVQKGLELGVKIISAEEFLKLLEN